MIYSAKNLPDIHCTHALNRYIFHPNIEIVSDDILLVFHSNSNLKFMCECQFSNSNNFIEAFN